MSSTGSPAGWYPDPGGSGLPRWWDGLRWTEHLGQPAAPAAPWVTPVPGAPSSRPGSRAGLVAAVVVGGVVLVLLLALVVHPYLYFSSFTTGSRTGAGGPLHSGAFVDPKPMDFDTAADGFLVTPQTARQVYSSFRAQHGPAMAARDYPGLADLEGGALAVQEPSLLSCGCKNPSEPASVGFDVLVPRQTSYPIHFLVIQSPGLPGSTDPTQVEVFEKRAATDVWRVVEISELPPGHTVDAHDKPVLDRAGFVAHPMAGQHARARTAALQLAQVWQQARDQRATPPSAARTFDLSGRTGGHLADLANSGNPALDIGDALGTFHYDVDPKDLLVEVEMAGYDLACQPIRVVMHWVPARGTKLVQAPDLSPWGELLPAGTYRSLTTRGAWQTCFEIPARADQPIVVLDQVHGGSWPSVP